MHAITKFAFTLTGEGSFLLMHPINVFAFYYCTLNLFLVMLRKFVFNIYLLKHVNFTGVELTMIQPGMKLTNRELQLHDYHKTFHGLISIVPRDVINCIDFQFQWKKACFWFWVLIMYGWILIGVDWRTYTDWRSKAWEGRMIRKDKLLFLDIQEKKWITTKYRVEGDKYVKQIENYIVKFRLNQICLGFKEACICRNMI